jgi:dihydroflavonol-4-reductase
MKVTVTGPTGHVGGNLVRALLERGDSVRALVYAEGPALDGLDVEQVRGDVLNPASLRRAFQDAEVVYHLAAVITLGNDRNGFARRVNVEGTQNVIDACRLCGVRRMVHMSSIHALSAYPRSEPVREDRALADAPRAPAYDRTKAEAERRVLQAAAGGFDAVILNPTGIVGPNDFELSRMGRFLLDLLQRRMRALVQGGFNWVDVRDVAAAAIAAAQRGVSGERYIIGGAWQSMRNIAEVVERLSGISAPALTVPAWVAALGIPAASAWSRLRQQEARLSRASLHAVQNHAVIDCTKAQTTLNHTARPFETSVADTIDWFRDAGLYAG